MPPKPPRAPYEKSAAPLAPPAEPAPIWALAIVPMTRLGQTEHNIVALLVQGDRVVETHVVPESNWDNLEGALNDFKRCATQGYRFKSWRELLAGRV